MGVLGVALQRCAEGLLGGRALVAQRAGQLAQNRVADHHRGELAAAEHVAADRDDVGGEVLDDPLVEALVAAAQQRQLRARPPARRPGRRRAAARPAPARSRAAARAAAAGRRRSGRAVRCRGRRPAAPSPRPRRRACRRPVPRSAGCGRGSRRTRSASRAAIALATWRWADSQPNHSGNSVKMSIFIGPPPPARRRPLPGRGLAAAPPGRGRRGRSRRGARAGSIVADRVFDHRHQQRLAAVGGGHLQRLAGGQLEEPRHRSHGALAVAHAAALQFVGPPFALLERWAPRVRRRSARGREAARLPRGRRSPRRRTIGRWSVPARRTIVRAAPPTATVTPCSSSRGRGRVT